MGTMVPSIRNENGDAVDPVPWLVVTGIAFLLCYAYLPLVMLEFSFGLDVIMLVVTVLFVGTALVSFREQILRARPDMAGEVPSDVRIRRLVLAMIIGAVVFLGLQVLMVARP